MAKFKIKGVEGWKYGQSPNPTTWHESADILRAHLEKPKHHPSLRDTISEVFREQMKEHKVKG